MLHRITIKTLKNVLFPVYGFRRGESIYEDDGIVTINDKLVDDRNVLHSRLSRRRRLTTSLLGKYNFIKAIQTPIALFDYDGRNRFIDSKGLIFTYKRTILATVNIFEVVENKQNYIRVKNVPSPIYKSIIVNDGIKSICLLISGKTIYGIWSTDLNEIGRVIQI